MTTYAHAMEAFARARRMFARAQIATSPALARLALRYGQEAQRAGILARMAALGPIPFHGPTPEQRALLMFEGPINAMEWAAQEHAFGPDQRTWRKA